MSTGYQIKEQDKLYIIPPFEVWFDYQRYVKSSNSTYNNMTETEALNHIKLQYQKLFQKPEKAQELKSFMGDVLFNSQFGTTNVNYFINNVVSDLHHVKLYGNFKIK